MRFWLIVILGAILAGISYAAYEMEVRGFPERQLAGEPTPTSVKATSALDRESILDSAATPSEPASGAGADADADSTTVAELEPGSGGTPAAPAAGEEEESAAAPEAADDTRPTFDVVTVDPDGTAVIAGRAVPGAEVTLQIGDKTIGTAMASDRGEWVIVPDAPLAGGTVTLDLAARLADSGETVRSDQAVTVIVPEEEGTEAEVAALEPDRDTVAAREPETSVAAAGEEVIPSPRPKPQAGSEAVAEAAGETEVAAIDEPEAGAGTEPAPEAEVETATGAPAGGAATSAAEDAAEAVTAAEPSTAPTTEPVPSAEPESTVVAETETGAAAGGETEAGTVVALLGDESASGEETVTTVAPDALPDGVSVRERGDDDEVGRVGPAAGSAGDRKQAGISGSRPGEAGQIAPAAGTDATVETGTEDETGTEAEAETVVVAPTAPPAVVAPGPGAPAGGETAITPPLDLTTGGDVPAAADFAPEPAAEEPQIEDEAAPAGETEVAGIVDEGEAVPARGPGGGTAATSGVSGLVPDRVPGVTAGLDLSTGGDMPRLPEATGEEPVSGVAGDEETPGGGEVDVAAAADTGEPPNLAEPEPEPRETAGGLGAPEPAGAPVIAPELDLSTGGDAPPRVDANDEIDVAAIANSLVSPTEAEAEPRLESVGPAASDTGSVPDLAARGEAAPLAGVSGGEPAPEEAAGEETAADEEVDVAAEETTVSPVTGPNPAARELGSPAPAAPPAIAPELDLSTGGDAASSATGSAATAEETGDQPAAPAAPIVVLSERGQPSRVLQGGETVDGEAGLPPITFDSVDYDDVGKIIIAGEVEAGADVRAYIDNQLLGDTRADGQGRWTLRATRDIEPGAYELRVDRIDQAGLVIARAAAPFERADPDVVAGARARGEVVIQPGDNLWNIARAVYGTGTQYTVIYNANSNQIMDPDLIYPGQILVTPGAAGLDRTAADGAGTSG